jgi:hypothetical protein
MKEILTDKMLREIFTALEKGETFEYSDANTQISINPNGISVRYTQDNTSKEVEDFLHFCDTLDDDLFIEACESFEENELDQLQAKLDTPEYKETVEVFTTRVKEIANNKLTEITNAATAELQRLEQLIVDARVEMSNIHHEVEEANRKYNV